MNPAELTSLVMASVAIIGVCVQANAAWRVQRKGQQTEHVASWSGLNNALDHDNQQLRAQINVLDAKVDLQQAEIDAQDVKISSLTHDLDLARRRIKLLEEKRDDRAPA